MKSSDEVSPRDYHTKLLLNRSNIFAKDSWLSKSALWQVGKMSLKKWRHHPPRFKETPAMMWGTLLDILITSPEEFHPLVRSHSFPDFRSKAARELKKEAKEAGHYLIKDDEVYCLKKARNELHAHPIAGPLINNSRKQVMLLNKLKGINFKGLVDIVPDEGPFLVDLKTTADLSADGLSRTVAKFGYHVQGAIYLKLWNLCHPDEPRDRFAIIWQESSEPFEVVVTELSKNDLNAGEEYAAFLIDQLIEAHEADEWPGLFGDSLTTISRPQYAIYQEEEEMSGASSLFNPLAS